jgi:hypothetical protein
MALAPLQGLGSALVAGGHLDTKGVVLVDQGLHLTVRTVNGDRALDIDENLNPVPGGAGATSAWILYLPSSHPLRASLEVVANQSAHLSIDEPPASAPAARSNESAIDLSTLGAHGDQS